MEAVPLSDISPAACARALICSWISRFGVPETITSDCGPQFTSNVWSQLCEMVNITHAKRTLIILRRPAQSKDSTAASKMRFLLAPPRQLGPRSYPGYSSDFERSQGKTLVFPLLRQFWEPQLACQMSFSMEKNFLLTKCLKFFWTLWMLLLFLSLASIIRVPCCLRSCQLTSAPPSSGYAKVAPSRRTQRIRTALYSPCI
jgi:hypothetical protein